MQLKWFLYLVWFGIQYGLAKNLYAPNLLENTQKAIINTALNKSDEQDPKSNSITSLTYSTFEKTVVKSKLSWIVKFYVPWCGHCQRLAPIFEEASQNVSGNIAFGQVDCTVEISLQNYYELKGFPTIIFFREGEKQIYHGERTIEAIVEFANKMLAPPVTLVINDTFGEFQKQNDVVMLYIGSQTSNSWKIFNKVAYRLQGIVGFAALYTNNQNKQFEEDLRSLHKLAKKTSAPLVMSFSKGSDPIIFSRFSNVDSFTLWVRENKLPIVSELSSANFNLILDSPKLNIFSVTDPSDIRSEMYIEVFTKVAQRHREDFIFANINGVDNHDYVSTFGFSDPNGMPSMFALNYFDDKFYFDPALHNDTENDQQDKYNKNYIFSDQEKDELLRKMDSFLEDVISGRAVAHYTRPWYSPMRYIVALEKWISKLDDTIFIFIIIIFSAVFFSLLLVILMYCDTNVDKKREPENTSNETEISRENNMVDDPGLRRRIKQSKNSNETTNDSLARHGSEFNIV